MSSFSYVKDQRIIHFGLVVAIFFDSFGTAASLSVESSEFVFDARLPIRTPSAWMSQILLFPFEPIGALKVAANDSIDPALKENKKNNCVLPGGKM
jgi:hypothetical protein